MPGKDFLALLETVGFMEVEFVGETGFNSSPVTRGALVRARRRTRADVTMVGGVGRSAQGESAASPTETRPDGMTPKGAPS